MEIINQKIIIYDGKCDICNSFIKLIKKKARVNFTCLNVHTKEARILLKRNEIQFANLNTIYFISDNKVFTRSVAIFQILKYVPYPMKAITWLGIFSPKLTDIAYSFFAKYRYRYI